jgi:uncharacterized protein
VSQATIAQVSEIAAEYLATGKCASCPVIDAHAHYGRYQGIYFPRPEAEGMLRVLDRAGVRLSICSPHAALNEPRRGNPIIIQAAHDHPGRFLAYHSVNPNYPAETEEDVAALEHRDPVVVGIKIHPGWHDYPMSGPLYAPAFRFADAHRMPVLSHTWGHNPVCGPEEVRKVAEAYPNAPILMGHSCFSEIPKAIELARTYANVYLELTAAYRVGGAIEAMVDGAGSEKVLFGTDIPWFEEHYGMGCVVLAHISDEDRRNILYRNAARLFGI